MTRATVECFLMVLTSKLTQYDARETAREIKRGGGNIYRLGLLFKALERVRSGVSQYLDRDDREAMQALRAAMLAHFTPGFSPVRNIEKQIDKWLIQGNPPSLVK
jgi:uncharacterized protein (DUF2336 family)